MTVPAGKHKPLVALTGIVKRFGRVAALAGADLSVEAGEVHALLGENGAGKTTLLNVLAGMLRPDAGEVAIEGRRVAFATPRDALDAGIGMVHQHFTLVPAMTVLENLALGQGGSPLARRGRLRSRVLTRASELGIEVDPDATVAGLGVGAQQRVEILKVILREPRILVLDEPTAVLAPPEVQGLSALLRRMAAGGRAVVLVAHKLDEVLAVADRVTVLRHGRTVLVAPRAEVDGPTLARAMVGRMPPGDGAPGSGGAGRERGGREGRPTRPQRGAADEPVALGDGGAGAEAPPGPGGLAGAEVVAELLGVSALGWRGEAALTDVSLEVRRGEVVGVAGVEGNGQRELARVLAGVDAPAAGRARLPAGPAWIPQDRHVEALVGDFDLAENVALAVHGHPGFRRGPLLLWPRIRERTRTLLADFSVRAPGPATLARALSGGNQQRLVLARELERSEDLLIAENPTRGLDVAAEAFVHRRFRSLLARPRPPGIVLLSTDLDEVLRLSDRIVVMVRGRLIPVPGDERTREGVGRLMLEAGPG